MGFVSTCKFCGHIDHEGFGNWNGICFDCKDLENASLREIFEARNNRENLQEKENLNKYLNQEMKKYTINKLSKELNDDELFLKIAEYIKSYKNKETQTSPEQFAELFILILKYGGLSNYDIKRFFKHFEHPFQILSNDQ